MTIALRIARLGAEADGVCPAEGDHPTIYVPYALDGELVEVSEGGKRGDALIGQIERILEPSPHRVEPICQHFGICGGCAMQHTDDGGLGWKAGQVASALKAVAPDVLSDAFSTWQSPPAVRRRIDFGLRRSGKTVRVGLHRARSAEIVDIQHCPVIDPSLMELIAALRIVLPTLALLKREGSAVANMTENGIDLLLRTDRLPSVEDRTLLAAFAHQHGLARISWAEGERGRPEVLCQLRDPVITFSGHSITAPPGAFLQASRAAEDAIMAAIEAGLPKKRRKIVELFAGIGTFTLRLKPGMAYEGDEAAVAAVKRAGFGQITRRDLFRQPLQAAELRGVDVVILDPPHAGAAAQCATLAQAKVPRIIYVSCNPHALRRDATLLAGAGYRLVSASVIDQFLWSTQIETVAVFSL
ncbi:class I SAM-dependent RNA methyltransferase [Granulibacter bethesdensis]|uniref:class I SAM-dependent RNA methyltransferase n=1 Tax=Granulibacter bethesdensis TaxID=364410 RepID=UPI0003F2003D|nr:class I SAM-dependent RNA methyltransferase [Granulibacter bethesdensis]AHJ66241.1 tRNA (Uracil-5-) -methyltransferase [Granulibacter bethesdensis CGDNIH4]